MRKASRSARSVPPTRSVPKLVSQAPRHASWVVALLFVATSVLWAVQSWISDDAFISFRAIENFVEGRGLVWNLGERVQAFTHPLWVLLLSGFCFFTDEYFLTVIGVSLALSIASMWMLVRITPSTWQGKLAVLLSLGLSVAFVSYTTSGLENPLTFFLLGLFLAAFWGGTSPRRSLILGLTGGLAMVNRYDNALLVGTPLLVAFWTEKTWEGRRQLLFGMTPIVAWVLFALVYYGSILPNCAIAKLYTGLSRSDYLHQGAVYFADALLYEPLTMIGILWGVAAAFIRRDRELLPLGIGVTLYLLFVLWVGGDFMRGRFLTAPFFLCLAILLRTNFLVSGRLLRWLPVVVLVLGIPTLDRAILAEPRNRARYDAQLSATGIGDERSYYIQSSGLTRGPLAQQVGHDMGFVRGRRAADPSRLRLVSVAGRSGYMSDPAAYVIDTFALSNPLMSRIAIREDRKWRIGHFERRVPAGYLGVLLGTGATIADPTIRELYTSVERVARGRLLAPDRWKHILRLNNPFGRKVYVLRQEELVDPVECATLARTRLEALDLQLLLGAFRAEIQAGDQEAAIRILGRMLWITREKRQSLLSTRDYVVEIVAGLKVLGRERPAEAEELLAFTIDQLPDRKEPLLALAELYAQANRDHEAAALRDRAARLPNR